jgi:hypothetical protein
MFTWMLFILTRPSSSYSYSHGREIQHEITFDAERLFSRYQKINILSFDNKTDLETLTWFTSFIHISCSSAVISTLAITTSSPTKAPGTINSRMCWSFFIFALLIAALASDFCVVCLIENLLDIDSA